MEATFKDYTAEKRQFMAGHDVKKLIAMVDGKLAHTYIRDDGERFGEIERRTKKANGATEFFIITYDSTITNETKTVKISMRQALGLA